MCAPVGGDNPSIAQTCSGGNNPGQCDSTRLMWRRDGAGEMYVYLPPSDANDQLCSVAPMSVCDAPYGTSVARGSFSFTPGAWTTVAQRVRLNDAGVANGELELWADGVSVMNVSGVVIRDSDAGRFYGLQIQTFFGGAFSSV